MSKETYIPRSTNIDEIVFDSDEQTMTITFKNGRAWTYSGVPQALFLGIQNAQSAGSYFIRHIKTSYPSEEV